MKLGENGRLQRRAAFTAACSFHGKFTRRDIYEIAKCRWWAIEQVCRELVADGHLIELSGSKPHVYVWAEDAADGPSSGSWDNRA